MREHILDHKWDDLARRWTALTKLNVSIGRFDNEVTGKFEQNFPEVVSAVAAALASGKSFISCLATVSLILDKLPSLPAKERADLIRNHLAKSRSQGAPPPANLVQYLEAELQKSTLEPSAGRKGQQAAVAAHGPGA